MGNFIYRKIYFQFNILFYIIFNIFMDWKEFIEGEEINERT